jgi:hypothetical protein
MRVLRTFDDMPESIRRALSDVWQDEYCSAEWFSLLERTVFRDDAEKECRIYVTDENGSAFCVPMFQDHAARCRVLSGLTNFYSTIFSPLVSGIDHVGPGIRITARYLASERPAWDVIQMRPVEADCGFSVMWYEALREAGFWVDRFFCFGNWYLKVQDRSFRQYFEGLSSKLRKNIPQAQRRLLRRSGFSLRIFNGTEPDIGQAIEDFQAVYHRSWKRPEPYPQFIPEFMGLATRNGWLRLGIVRIGAVPAAVQLWTVAIGRASIYKVAYDEQFKKDSVGTVLSAAMMEHVIDVDRVAEVDYLIGDDPYKQYWMSHRRERFGIIGFNKRTPAGIIRASGHFGGRVARRLQSIVSRTNNR